MNNILSFNEYNGQELEVIAYENALNEGLRNFFNKIAARKVRSELSDEIEMSKSIMGGIKEGLDSLSDNFETIKRSIDNTDQKTAKGKKQETLDAIVKIIEDSRKKTWDLNELIDEGEIDYTGFTANIGIASVAYFGILLTPFRATIMIHKGYNYFFNLIKNTIRKALVMLQLNFDQFENLIITKGFQSSDYIQASDSSEDISMFYGNITAQLFGDEGKVNKTMGKKKSEQIKQLLQAAKQKFDLQMKADKQIQQADNAYNCLDMYNNTYTKSLETLRQYSSEDTQKQLDAIKNSMNKLAGQEADLQTYSELIIASAEEHAYKVSSSIYNKFAKMTEVFSLPNQKKMIDLIMDANKEQQKEAKRIRKEMKANKELQEKIESNRKKESEGLDIFKSIDGVEIGNLEGEEGAEIRKYDPAKINAKNWTYSEFRKKSEDEQESLEIWFQLHPEVLKQCDETLQIYIETPPSSLNYNTSYIDSLIDYIGICLVGDNKKNESVILNFDDYLFESDDKKTDEPTLSDDDKEEIDSSIKDVEDNFGELLKLIFGKEVKDFDDLEITPENKAKLDYVLSKYKDSDDPEDEDDIFYKYPTPISKLKRYKKELDSKDWQNKKVCYLDLSKNNIDNTQFNIIKKLYRKKTAPVALVAIGKKVLKDSTFTKNSENIVSIINKCVESKSRKQRISFMTYILLEESIKELKDLRNHDYAALDEAPENKKSEE